MLRGLSSLVCMSVLALAASVHAQAQAPAPSSAAVAQAQPQGPTLSLAQALEAARAHAPQLRRARATSEASRAHIGVARAPLLPQLTGTASYDRGTQNVSRTTATGTFATPSTFATFDNWNFGLRASQLIYDFGQTTNAYRAAKANAMSDEQSERAAVFEVELDVRIAYFAAAAQKQLLVVAREALENQERHRAQIEAFVTVGTRPAIDLAQVRTDVANAKLAVVRADNAYATSKAELAHAMGTPPGPFEVAGEVLAPIDGEDAPLSQLVEEARRSRPELAALASQLRAQELTISAIEGAYGPSLSAAAQIGENGRQLDSMAGNWSAGITLTWPIFQGGLTRARAREARAVLENVRTQASALENDIQLALEQARLNVHGAREALVAADEVVTNARAQRDLANARYQAGAGNVIELADAELALRNAQADRASADFDLASARAQLLAALGR